MAVKTAGRAILGAMLEEWSGGAYGVWLYDFGDGITHMPIPDAASGSYRTSSVCVMLTCKPSELPVGALLPNLEERTKDYGPGQRAQLVEIKTNCTPEELTLELGAARHKLLGG